VLGHVWLKYVAEDRRKSSRHTSFYWSVATGDRSVARKAAGVAHVDGQIAHVARADVEREAAGGVQQQNIPGRGPRGGATAGRPGATADPPFPGGLHRCSCYRVQRERDLRSSCRNAV
jgi:hypothetical protein